MSAGYQPMDGKDTMKLALIWAMSRNRVIGRNNALPWYLPEEKHQEHIRTITGK